MVDDVGFVASTLGSQFDAAFAGDGDLSAIDWNLRRFIDSNPSEALAQIRIYLEQRWDVELLPREMRGPDDVIYNRELERWAMATMNFLRPGLADFAKSLCGALLLNVRGLQELKSIRLHKGAAYYNFGVAELLRREMRSALDYFLLAAVEDALIAPNWREGHAAAMLRAYWNPEVEFPRVADLARRVAAYSDATGGDYRLVAWNPELSLMLHPEG